MAYNYSPISMPSSSGGGLDFGTLPRMQLGDTKSLTSFYDKQREHEDKESKFGQEEFTKLLKNLDADELEFAIGDDPRAREHLGQVTGYYTDKMKSLINRAGTPGTIKEMSKLSLDLYRDMNDPTGRLYPFVSAARERKKYLEKTKSAEYQKALAEDPDYDFENRQTFKNWKGSLSWNEEGMPQYNKLRIGEAEAPISLEGISKRLKGMVEEETLSAEEWRSDPSGLFVNVPSVKGRDMNKLYKTLMSDKDFERYAKREIAKMGDASEEEKKKRVMEIADTLTEGLTGREIGGISAPQDDPRSFNFEEQQAHNLRVKQLTDAEKQRAIQNNIAWSNLGLKQQGLEQKERHHQDRLSAMKDKSLSQGSYKDNQHRTSVTTDDSGYSTAYANIFADGKSPLHVGNDYLVSPSNLTEELKSNKELLKHLLGGEEAKSAFVKSKQAELNKLEKESLMTVKTKTGERKVYRSGADVDAKQAQIKKLKEEIADPVSALVKLKLGKSSEEITKKIKAMPVKGIAEKANNFTISVGGTKGVETRKQFGHLRETLSSLTNDPYLKTLLRDGTSKDSSGNEDYVDSITRIGNSDKYKVTIRRQQKKGGVETLTKVLDAESVAQVGQNKTKIQEAQSVWNTLLRAGGETNYYDTGNSVYKDQVVHSEDVDNFLSKAGNNQVKNKLNGVFANPNNFTPTGFKVYHPGGNEKGTPVFLQGGESKGQRTYVLDIPSLSAAKLKTLQALIDEGGLHNDISISNGFITASKLKYIPSIIEELFPNFNAID